jgi:hypothetical protein
LKKIDGLGGVLLPVTANRAVDGLLTNQKITSFLSDWLLLDEQIIYGEASRTQEVFLHVVSITCYPVK